MCAACAENKSLKEGNKKVVEQQKNRIAELEALLVGKEHAIAKLEVECENKEKAVELKVSLARAEAESKMQTMVFKAFERGLDRSASRRTPESASAAAPIFSSFDDL